MLDLAQTGYNNRGYFRNDWKNAIITGGSAYDGGEAGKGYGQGRLDTCIGYCSFTGNYSSGPADWYFKLGLE